MHGPEAWFTSNQERQHHCYKNHPRVENGAIEFSSRSVPGYHINGIEGFWGYANSRLARFRGVHPDRFLFRLRESEFRFNHRNDNPNHVLLELCRENPLSES